MQRQIKFRAWDNKKCKMILWIDMLKHKGLMWGVLGCIKTTTFQHQDDKVGITTNDYTPMQYTGLKDKNGIEIYEGDILSHHKQGNRFVEYGNTRFSYGGYMLVTSCGMRGTLSDTESLYEVIGNIYENKDLL